MNKIYSVGISKVHEKVIRKVASFALARVVKLLNHKKEISIVIFESAPINVIPQLGITGRALGKSGVIIEIDFSRKDINKIITQQLPATIGHEVTHLVREDAIGYSKTLFDSLVSEGISCVIEKHLQPNAAIPYIVKIKGEDSLYIKANPFLNKSRYNHAEWFFGAGKLPKWAGYRLGYILVTNYLRENKVTYSQLVRIASNKFA